MALAWTLRGHGVGGVVRHPSLHVSCWIPSELPSVGTGGVYPALAFLTRLL